MKLLDKSVLVAEIKRLLAFYLKEIENNKKDPWAMDIAKRDILQEILSFLDTLEVKEVDLNEHQIVDIIQNQFTTVQFIESETLLLGRDETILFAKHFFELGLRVNNEKEK